MMIFGPKMMDQGPYATIVRVKIFANGTYQSLMSITALLDTFGSVRTLFFTIFHEKGLFWPFFGPETDPEAV